MFGIYTKFRRLIIKLAENSQAGYFRYKKQRQTFIFNKNEYAYFIHPYNYTWRNERIIEIPIIKKILEDNKGQDILEVGNVMSHYVDITHDVLDKYEQSKGVINQDVVDFNTKKKYDLIIAVSTLEHVGWDEQQKDNKKVLRAIARLKKILKKDGKIIITHPLGYNKYMDKYIKNGKIKLDQIFLMKRVSKDNRWKQIRWNEPLPVASLQSRGSSDPRGSGVSRKRDKFFLNHSSPQQVFDSEVTQTRGTARYSGSTNKKLKIRYHYPFPYANGLVVGIKKS